MIAGLGVLLLGSPTAVLAVGPNGDRSSGLVLVQAGGIKGQDPSTAGKGEVATGWVQAPVPRDANAPQQPAQGAGAAPVGTNPGQSGGQAPPGQNPGTVVHNPLPGPGGNTSGQ
jgi:hypothetical protein